MPQLDIFIFSDQIFVSTFVFFVFYIVNRHILLPINDFNIKIRNRYENRINYHSNFLRQILKWHFFFYYFKLRFYINFINKNLDLLFNKLKNKIKNNFNKLKKNIKNNKNILIFLTKNNKEYYRII